MSMSSRFLKPRQDAQTFHYLYIYASQIVVLYGFITPSVKKEGLVFLYLHLRCQFLCTKSLEMKALWFGGRAASNRCCLMSAAAGCPLCFPKSSVNVATYLELREHFMLLSADKLYGEAGFYRLSAPGTRPHSQRYQELVQ